MPSTPGCHGAGPKRNGGFSAGFKVKRWKEPGNYIPKFWFFARLEAEKKTNDWSKVGSPFFFWSFLEGLYKPTKKFPLILLSVPMRRACRFFLFFCFEAATKYKLKPDWYVQSCLKFEMFGAWFLSGLVHQPCILSLLWQAAQPKPPRGSYH